MQEFGNELDRQTNGDWVREDFDRALKASGANDIRIALLDAVRIPEQIGAFRKAYGRRVLHVHLTASDEELTRRYKNRPGEGITELPNYAEVQKNETEQSVSGLQVIADIVIETDRCTERDVLIRVASHIGVYPREYQRLVDVIVGGQYGSEGKGQIAAFLAPEYGLIVRTGGPNAGHKVYEKPDPYTFHQLPSGTRRSEARLLIGAGAVITPDILLREIADCRVEAKRLSIDPQAIIITAADRNDELTLVQRIGSTGQGVGRATARRVLRGEDVTLAKNIKELEPFIRRGIDVLEETFKNGERVLLEGTQGTGLSLYHGHYPHVTSRDTTVAGCLAEAGISPSRVQRIVMVCRTYPIRVESPKDGDSGFMSQPIPWAEVARRSGISQEQLRATEKTSTTGRTRRVAEFDWELLRTASSLNAPTDIALTFVDYLAKSNSEARRFEQLTSDTIRFIEEVEKVAAAPVTLISTRFHFRSIIDRRMW